MAAVGVGAAFAGLAATLKVGFDELSEGQKVAAQTGAVLKSTGGAARVTAQDVDALAQSLSHLTGVDDEAIQAGENMLLTFTQIQNKVGKSNDIFNQATKATLDLSVAMGKDMSTSAILVGKALNDPVSGMTALRKVGVRLTEDQKKLVEGFVKSGDVMSAQKVILKELNTEFGGSAKAFGETMPGQLAKLKNSFEEMAGSIAQTLLPHLQSLVTWTNDHMPEIKAVIEAMITGIVAAIDFLVPVVQKIITAFEAVAAAAEKHWPRVKAAAETVANWYRNNLEPTITSVSQNIAKAWQKSGEDSQGTARNSFGGIPPIIKAQMNNVGSVINIGLALLRGDWSKAWAELKEIPVRTFRAIIATAKTLGSAFFNATLALGKAGMAGLFSGLNAGWQRAYTFVTSIPGKIKAAFAGAGQWLYNAGAAVLQGFLNGLKSKVGAVTGFLDSVTSIIPLHKGPPAKDAVLLYRVGQLVMEGFQKGMEANWAKIESWLGGLSPKVATRMGTLIDAAKAAIEARKGTLASAFQTLVSEALAAFDKLGEGLKTKSEKLLAAFDLKQAVAAAKKQIADLQKAVNEALAAQSTMRQEPIEPQRAGETAEDFQKRQLEAEEKWNAQKLAAQKSVDDALAALAAEREVQRLAKEREGLEKAAAEERKKLEERQALRRRHLGEELAAAGNNLEKVLKVLKKYGIPIKDAGAKLGLALAEGLTESIADTRKAAKALGEEIIEQLRKLGREIAKIRFVVHVEVVGAGAGAGTGNAPGMQHGGRVRRGRPYIVGERQAELFVPDQSGRVLASVPGAGGGGTIENHTHVYLDSREIFTEIQRKAIRFQNANATPAFQTPS